MQLLAACRAGVDSKTTGAVLVGADQSKNIALQRHNTRLHRSACTVGDTQTHWRHRILRTQRVPTASIVERACAQTWPISATSVYAVRCLSSEWPFDLMKLLVHQTAECAPCAGENRQVPSINQVGA